MRLKIALGTLAIAAELLHAETDVFADLLIWNATESGTESWGQVFTKEDLTTNVDVLSVRFGVNLGLRVGLNYFTCHDSWNTQLSYTWFSTEEKESAKTDGEIASAFLGNFYINNADGTGLGPSYRKADLRWEIDLNVFDWQLGRVVCISDCLSLRPYLGLKGGWIDQTIDTNWKHPTNSALPYTKASEKLKNDFWGIGPVGGLKINWIFCEAQCHTFSLFNDLLGSLMYGHWSFQDCYENNRPQEVIIEIPTIRGVATMVRELIGLSWERSGERFCFSIRLGYEAQFWLGQLQFYSLNLGRLNNMLTLQGGSLDFRFAF